MNGLAFSRKRVEPVVHGQRSSSREGGKAIMNARDFYGHSLVAIENNKGNFNPLGV
jgi:hypothetical protein